MRWISHIAIACAVCAVLNPLAVPAAAAGSTAPDWIEMLRRAVSRRKVKHRGATHYLVGWLLVMAFALVVWDWNGWVFWFGAGGLIHWLCDALTVTGAPVGWWSDRRITIFGGKVKTGGTYEYIITTVIVAICVLLIVTRATTAGGFIPFFYEWGGFFERGLVDGLEWRNNRFNMI